MAFAIHRRGTPRIQRPGRPRACLALVSLTMFTLASIGVGGCSSSDLAFGGHGLDTGYGSLSGGEEETDTGDDRGASESATAGDSTTGMEDDGTDSGDTTGETGAGTSDGPGDCDPFAQDCDPGLKCSWVEGDYGPETVCVPLEEIPAEDGANCVVATAEDPSDPCDLGSICAYPDAYGIGVCTPMCGGEAAAPLCGENQVCQPCPDCPSLCLDGCDPLDGICPDGLMCAPSMQLDTFVCTMDVSNAESAQGSTCEFANECAPGLACVDNSALDGCEGSSCCAPYCDLTADEPQCDGGAVCSPWPFEGSLPGYEYVGVCTTGAVPSP